MNRGFNEESTKIKIQDLREKANGFILRAEKYNAEADNLQDRLNREQEKKLVKNFSETIMYLDIAGISMDELKEAIKKGDLLTLQEKMEIHKAKTLE